MKMVPAARLSRAAASPRLVPTECPRRCRGVAAARLHRMSPAQPKGCDSSPRNVPVAAGRLRLVSTECPRRGRGGRGRSATKGTPAPGRCRSGRATRAGGARATTLSAARGVPARVDPISAARAPVTVILAALACWRRPFQAHSNRSNLLLPHGRSTWHPRRGRDSPRRTIDDEDRRARSPLGRRAAALTKTW